MKVKSLLGIVAVLALLLGACANSVGPSTGPSDISGIKSGTVDNAKSLSYDVTTVSKDGKNYYRITFSYVDKNGNQKEGTIDMPADITIVSVVPGTNEDGNGYCQVTFTYKDENGSHGGTVKLPDGSTIESIEAVPNENGGVDITITYTDSNGDTQETTVTVANDNQGDDNPQGGGATEPGTGGNEGAGGSGTPEGTGETTEPGTGSGTGDDTSGSGFTSLIDYSMTPKYVNKAKGYFNYTVTFIFDSPIDLSNSGAFVIVNGSGDDNDSVKIALKAQDNSNNMVWVGTAPLHGVGDSATITVMVDSGYGIGIQHP